MSTPRYKTRSYQLWMSIRQRCENPGSRAFKTHGGRGVKVCERWQRYESFVADMGEPPPGMMMVRDSPASDFSPQTCRWAPIGTQPRNDRLFLEFTEDQLDEIRGRWEHGETQQSVAARFGTSQMTISRIVRGVARWSNHA